MIVRMPLSNAAVHSEEIFMRTLLLGACSAIALYAGSAHAQVAEVLVTGYLEEELPQELARYGVRVETVTAEEILDGGYYDITEILEKQTPGMFIAARGGVFDYVNVSYQGSRTQDILWLVDGVRINNRLYAGTTPVDTIPAVIMERIEALEGGQSLFYGTQGIAGAVNMVTRGFSETSDGMVKGGLNTNNGWNTSGYYRDSFGAHQFVVYASHDQADGFQPFRDQDYQPTSTDRDRSYEVTTLGGKYGIDFTNDLRFSTTYQHTDAKLDHSSPKGPAFAFNTRNEDILTGKIDFTPSDMFEFFAKGYYHWWDAAFSQANNTNPPSGTFTFFDDNIPWWFHDYGLNLLGKFDSGSGVEIFGGYDFQSYVGQDDFLVIAKQKANVHALFSQIRTTDDLFENGRIAFGVRHNMPSGSPDATVWNVSGQLDLSPDLFIRSSLGTSFRLPTAEELFARDACCTFGNPNLEPERGFGLNASIGGRLPIVDNFNWEVVGFFRDIDNLIQSDADIIQETFTNAPGTVEVRGFQVVLDSDLTRDLSADASFTYSSSELAGTNTQINDIPTSHWKFGIDYHPMSLPFGLYGNLVHVGDIYRNFSDPIGRQNYGGYTIVDVGARYFIDQDRRHRIGVHLQNAFDEEYATRVRTTTPDGGGDSYVYWHLGTPRTLRVDYSFLFSIM